LTHELDPPLKGAALTRRVELAEGLIGRAVWIDDKGAGNADRYAERLLTAAAEGAGSWAELALAQAPWGARGDFAAMLDALAVRLRRRLADEAATGETAAAARHLDALRRVEETRATVGTNANPQLALAVLAQELERLA
jgi:hypothetical protein